MDQNVSSQVHATWLGLPVIVTEARLLRRELTLQNELLRVENKILKSKIRGHLLFTNDERRSPVNAAPAMGRKLMELPVSRHGTG